MGKQARNYRPALLIIISIILISILTIGKVENDEIPTNIIQPQADAVTTNPPDEFMQLELTYLGSAKVKNNDVFMWDEEECATYEDALSSKEYTYSYRLFSSKEDYKLLDDEADFYGKWFRIGYEEGKMYVCSYGKRLEWLKYNPSWQANTGGLVNRAGFEEMDIEEEKVYFYEFHYDPLEYGYLADMFDEKENPPNEFVDLPLTYVGCTKWRGDGPQEVLVKTGGGRAIEEDDLRYEVESYYFIEAKSDYESVFEASSGKYDMDFPLEMKEGKIYVLKWEREMEWLQYFPAEKNDCNRLATRAGLNWDMETQRDMLYIYECNYDFRIYGWLYDVL